MPREITPAEWEALIPDRPSMPDWARAPHAFRPTLNADMAEFCERCACTREIGPHYRAPRKCAVCNEPEGSGNLGIGLHAYGPTNHDWQPKNTDLEGI